MDSAQVSHVIRMLPAPYQDQAEFCLMTYDVYYAHMAGTVLQSRMNDQGKQTAPICRLRGWLIRANMV